MARKKYKIEFKLAEVEPGKEVKTEVLFKKIIKACETEKIVLKEILVRESPLTSYLIAEDKESYIRMYGVLNCNGIGRFVELRSALKL